MRKSKLIRLLKSLSEDEIKGLYQFTKGLFYTRSEGIVKFYKLLRKYHPIYESSNLEKGKVFKKLFPQYQYSDIKLRVLMRKLTLVVEEFLIYQEFQKDEFLRKKELTRIYRKRNLDIDFQRDTNKLLEELEEQPIRDTDYFFNSYYLQKNLFFYGSPLDQKGNTEILKAAIKNMDHFFSIERLKLFYDLKNRKKIFSEFDSLTQELNDLSTIKPPNNILVDLYSLLFSLNDSEKELKFNETKQLFLNNISKLSKEDNQIILIALLNYAISKTSKLEIFYLQEIFSLYKVGLKNKLLLKNNLLTESTFINIVVTGSKLKEFEWVMSFIIENENYLPSGSKKSILKLSYGFWHFHQAEFIKVLDILKTFSFSNILFQINARTLVLRAYYKLAEKDASFISLIQSNIDTFDKYIRRNKFINESKKEAYLNFSLVLKKMLNHLIDPLKIKQNQKEILDYLYNLNICFAKTWLKENILNP